MGKIVFLAGKNVFPPNTFIRFFDPDSGAVGTDEKRDRYRGGHICSDIIKNDPVPKTFDDMTLVGERG